MAGGEPWDLELPFIRADGRRIWTRAVGSVEFDEGKPVRLVGAFQDVTERVAARLALQEADERVALALSSGRMGIWDWDIANDRMTWSAEQYRLYGMEPNDTGGTYTLWSRHLHPDDRAATEQKVANALSGIQPYDAEFRILWSDGSVHHLRGTGRVTRDASGRAVRMVGINWDVTEERRLAVGLNARIVAQAEAEKALITAQSAAHRLEAEAATQQAAVAERAAARFRALLDAAPDPMLVVGPDGPITLANERALDVFGYALHELVGQSIDRLIPRELWAASPRNGRPLFIAGTARREDGSEFPVEVSRSISGFDSEASLILTIRDVTERRALEASLESSRVQITASARLSALGTMAGGIAHEINNPLAIISASADDLRDLAEADAASRDDVLRTTNRVLQCTDRISKIVRSLRYVARDGTRDTFARASVEDIVLRTLDLILERFQQNSVELHAPRIDPGLWLECREVNVSQILLNLLQNAFDAATEAEGRKWVHLEVSTEGDQVIFSVIDSGNGVPPDARERIMEPFFTTKPVGKGTGLGLSLSKQMALEHGGNLDLGEWRGHTCFFLRLPRTQESLIECT